jgi:hypothetical protein
MREHGSGEMAKVVWRFRPLSNRVCRPSTPTSSPFAPGITQIGWQEWAIM